MGRHVVECIISDAILTCRPDIDKQAERIYNYLDKAKDKFEKLFKEREKVLKRLIRTEELRAILPSFASKAMKQMSENPDMKSILAVEKRYELNNKFPELIFSVILGELDAPHMKESQKIKDNSTFESMIIPRNKILPKNHFGTIILKVLLMPVVSSSGVICLCSSTL